MPQDVGLLGNLAEAVLVAAVVGASAGGGAGGAGGGGGGAGGGTFAGAGGGGGGGGAAASVEAVAATGGSPRMHPAATALPDGRVLGPRRPVMGPGFFLGFPWRLGRTTPLS